MQKYKICSNKECIYKGKLQPLENFYPNKICKDGLDYYCKKCEKRRGRKWQKENPERHRESVKKCYRKNKESYKKRARNRYEKNPEKARERTRRWRKENPEKIKNYRKRNEIKIRKSDKKWKKENPKKVRESQKRRRDRKKKDVFNHYGNKCIRCGNKDVRVLEINHKNGGGTQHKKSLNKSLYVNIIKNNYPPEYNILCANCNWIEYCKKDLGNPYLNKRNFQNWLISLSYPKRYTWKTKYKVIEHYTKGEMKCALCPKDDLRILTIDHIIPRSFSGGKRKRTSDLIKEKFPLGFRILCRNCQKIAYLKWTKREK